MSTWDNMFIFRSFVLEPTAPNSCVTADANTKVRDYFPQFCFQAHFREAPAAPAPPNQQREREIAGSFPALAFLKMAAIFEDVVRKRGARERGSFGVVTMPKAVRDRTMFLVEQLAALLRERSSVALAELELSLRQHMIMCCVQEFGICSRTLLAKWTGLDRAEVGAHLRGLSALELLSIDVNDTDRRHDEISLTADGAQLLALAELRLDRVEADVFRGVLDDQRARLRTVAAEALLRNLRGDESEG